MISWFPKFAFTFNLYRYTLGFSPMNTPQANQAHQGRGQHVSQQGQQSQQGRVNGDGNGNGHGGGEFEFGGERGEEAYATTGKQSGEEVGLYKFNPGDPYTLIA
jgi:hypothetical protein